MDILGPIIGASADLTARLLNGATTAAVAKAELRGILSVGNTRLDQADEVFKKRDLEESARVAHEDKEPTKP